MDQFKDCHLFCFSGKFTSFNASWPGSTHDAHVFKTSGLKRMLEATHKTLAHGIILGDSGYALTSFKFSREPKAHNYY